KNNKKRGIFSQFSSVDGDNSTITGNKDRNIEAVKGGTIYMSNSFLNNSEGTGVRCFDGKIFCRECEINNNKGEGIRATRGGEIVAYNSTISGNTKRGVVSTSSIVHVNNSTIKNNGERNVEAGKGGVVYANTVTASNGGSSYDYNVFTGGKITCYGS